MSYYIKYWSEDGCPLIGDVMEGQTSRFQLRRDAELRAFTIRDLHVGRKIGMELVPSDLYPEIFYHCKGYPATAIGCLCFGCKKKLTVEDAKKAGGEA